MSTLESIGPVARQVDAYNARDVDAFVACYAEDVVVRHGSGRVLLRGREQLRRQYSELFASNGDLHAVVVSRRRAGTWVVDEERVTVAGNELHALVCYDVPGDLITTVVMLTPVEGKDDGPH